jgi:hypothetical protein
MSENKTGKYFKYAIGEIVLVMVGILLALQVNNWNENRKEHSQQKILISQLLEDAKSDSSFYNNRFKAMQWVDSTINAAKLLGEGKSVNSAMFRTHGTGSVFSFSYVHYASMVLDNNPNAYDKVISPEIKLRLRKFYSSFLYMERSFMIFNNILEKDVKQLSKKYYKELRANKDMKSFDSLLEVYRDDDFQSIIDPISRQVEILNERLTEILAANNELIQTLNDALK